MVAEPIRLSKRVAALVPCSRREAEQYIAAGLVRVDGRVVDEPQERVTQAQQVTVERAAGPAALAPVTLLLNKQAGLSLAASLEALPLPRAHRQQQAVLMPLPDGAAGLCVFSQDRRIVRKLTEEAAFVEQEFVAEVAGEIAPDGLQKLNRGMKASWQSEKRLRFAGKGLDASALPRLCAEVGLAVTQLRRIRLGRVPMAGLAPGQWRLLASDERF